MSAPYISLFSVLSVCRKLSKLVDIWRTCDKNSVAQFFWDTVGLALCCGYVWLCRSVLSIFFQNFSLAFFLCQQNPSILWFSWWSSMKVFQPAKTSVPLIAKSSASVKPDIRVWMKMFGSNSAITSSSSSSSDTREHAQEILRVLLAKPTTKENAQNLIQF